MVFQTPDRISEFFAIVPSRFIAQFATQDGQHPLLSEPQGSDAPFDKLHLLVHVGKQILLLVLILAFAAMYARVRCASRPAVMPIKPMETKADHSAFE